MNSKAERERTKQIQDKCQHLLNEMLKDDDNKYCVDCDAKGEVLIPYYERIFSPTLTNANRLKYTYVCLGPRWASWNIGIFLCIRCAGLHRKLGVHISKVKSVNLDTWTPQQVVVRFLVYDQSDQSIRIKFPIYYQKRCVGWVATNK